MLKFGRNYRLSFKIGKRLPSTANTPSKIEWIEEIDISYPLTLNFTVTRAPYATMNNAFFQIMNLNQNTFSKIYRDRFDPTKVIKVDFYAGYGEDLPLVFSGEVFECNSYKEGKGTEFLTEISCLTGLFTYNFLYTTRVFAANTKPLDVIKTLCKDADLKLGAYSEEIVNAIPPLPQDTPFNGKSIELLNLYVNYKDAERANVIVDNGEVIIAGKNDVREADTIILDADAGLLGYPKRRNMTIDVELLFEPRLVQNQLINLVSKVDEFFNGTYKVVGFSHSGVISGAVGGQCRTKALLFVGGQSFNFVKKNE